MSQLSIANSAGVDCCRRGFSKGRDWRPVSMELRYQLFLLLLGYRCQLCNTARAGKPRHASVIPGLIEELQKRAQQIRDRRVVINWVM